MKILRHMVSEIKSGVESYCKFVHSVFCSILSKAIWLVLLVPVYVLAQHEWFASLWPY